MHNIDFLTVYKTVPQLKRYISRFTNLAMVGLGVLVLVFATSVVAQDALPSRGDYILGVGDVIRVIVHGEEDLALETRLDESGFISYTFLGELQATGLTVRQLESTIKTGLQPDYLKKPEVQVSVLAYRNFFINGEVQRPGGYPYFPGLTIQKAASLAGGFTERASTRKIYIIRDGDSAGRVQANLDSIVKAGDTVIVEEGLF